MLKNRIRRAGSLTLAGLVASSISVADESTGLQGPLKFVLEHEDECVEEDWWIDDWTLRLKPANLLNEEHLQVLAFCLPRTWFAQPQPESSAPSLTKNRIQRHFGGSATGQSLEFPTHRHCDSHLWYASRWTLSGVMRRVRS